jgi:predicted small secreted protein
MKRIILQFISVAAVAMLVSSCVTVPNGGGDGKLSVGIEDESKVECADVFLDGRFLACIHRGEDFKDFEMPAGYYRMRIVVDGYEMWEREIQVVGGTDYQIIHVRLQEILAFLRQHVGIAIFNA